MKFKNFEYTKKKDGETKHYFVLVLEDSDTHFGGIELPLLEDSEINTLLEIQREYESKMKPFHAKAFRQFIKANVANSTPDPVQPANPQ